MICYASRTGTKRNLDMMRAHGWGLLVSRAGVWRREGFDNWVADNGAWADFKAGRPFDEDEFERFLEWVAQEDEPPRWIVLPDIVAGGLASLALSVRYANRALSIAPEALIAVQDGMTEVDLLSIVAPQRIGIFLGGSTEWKLENMVRWGKFCARWSVRYHVARVNSAKRMFIAQAAGAHSVDGSSASRFAVSLRNLDNASRHLSLPFLEPATNT